MSAFNIADLRAILANCEEYEPGHHLHRPFMSAYQIAIRFVDAHPDHPLVRVADTNPDQPLVQGLLLGGEGTGEHQSLVQRIARFLSGAIKKGEAGDIEGGFISHDNIKKFKFRDAAGNSSVQVSTLKTSPGHSIFRVR